MRLLTGVSDPTPTVGKFEETGEFPGLGTDNANGDFSSLPGHFCMFPNVKREFIVEKIIVSIQATGVVKSDRYGTDMQLANGIKVGLFDSNGQLQDLLDGVTIMTNQDWERLTGNIRVPPFTPTNGLTVVWDLPSSAVMSFKRSEFIAVTLNDDFKDLDGHFFLCEGRSLPAR